MAGAANDDPVPLRGAPLVAEAGDAAAIRATSETTTVPTTVAFSLVLRIFHTRASLVACFLPTGIRGNSLVVIVRANGASILSFRLTFIGHHLERRAPTCSTEPSIAWGQDFSNR